MPRFKPPFHWSSILIFLAAILVVGGVYGYFSAEKGNRELEAAWKEALGGQTFPEKYPPAEDSEVIVELRRLAARIGITTAHPDRPEQLRPSDDRREAYQAVQQAISEQYDRIRATTDGRWPAAPEEARVFLETSASTLDEIESLLQESEPGVLERDLLGGFSAPLPNFLGYLSLHKLLIVKAGEEARLGREADALESLEASWWLQAAVASSPSLIAALVRHALIRGEQPVLRSLCRVPEVWQQRLETLDLLEGTFLALQHEAWLPYIASRQEQALGEDEDDSYLVRAGLRDYARRFQKSLMKLRQQDLATLDPEAFFQAEMDDIPRWQVVTRMLYPNFMDAWTRAARVELSAELTSLVLKERRRRRSGAAPSPSGRRPSSVSGLDWIYETTPEGLTLRLDGDLVSPGLKPLPVTFTLPPEGRDLCLRSPSSEP